MDNATTVMLTDPIGDRIQASLIRVEVVPVAEKVLQADGGRIEQLQNVVPETKPQKTVEFLIEMRPDVAFAIANNLLATLQNLSSARKEMYGIPANVAPIPAVQARGIA